MSIDPSDPDRAAESVPPPLPVLPIDAIEPTQSIRFCRICGASWQLSWSECPQCSARGNKHVAVAEATATFQSDTRRVKSAIGLYFCLLMVSIVAMVILAIRNESSPTVPVVTGAEIAMALITLIWCIPFAKDLKPQLLKVPNPLWLLFGAAASVVTLLLASFIVTMLHKLLNVPHQGYLNDFFKEGYGWGWAVASVCVQPAIFEELGFRGVILSSLEPVIGAREALLVSALMFAILHLSLPSLPHLFVMGAAFAWLRQRTGSLYAGMVMHFCHNLLVLITEQHPNLLPWG